MEWIKAGRIQAGGGKNTCLNIVRTNVRGCGKSVVKILSGGGGWRGCVRGDGLRGRLEGGLKGCVRGWIERVCQWVG